MKKRRVKRGVPAMMVPSMPSKNEFIDKCVAKWGAQRILTPWGSMSFDTFFDQMKIICDNHQSTARDLRDTEACLKTVGFDP